jgi:hypothetical protein
MCASDSYLTVKQVFFAIDKKSFFVCATTNKWHMLSHCEMKGVRVNILFTLYVDCNCCLEVIILPTVFPRGIHIITTNYALKKGADLAQLTVQHLKT